MQMKIQDLASFFAFRDPAKTFSCHTLDDCSAPSRLGQSVRQAARWFSWEHECFPQVSTCLHQNLHQACTKGILSPQIHSMS